VGAAGPGVGNEEMALTIMATAFVEQFGDLYGVDKCSPEDLWAAVNQGESSALLGRLHVGLLRVRLSPLLRILSLDRKLKG
jgi:hypothetical protein